MFSTVSIMRHARLCINQPLMKRRDCFETSEVEDRSGPYTRGCSPEKTSLHWMRNSDFIWTDMMYRVYGTDINPWWCRVSEMSKFYFSLSRLVTRKYFIKSLHYYLFYFHISAIYNSEYYISCFLQNIFALVSSPLAIFTPEKEWLKKTMRSL